MKWLYYLLISMLPWMFVYIFPLFQLIMMNNDVQVLIIDLIFYCNFHLIISVLIAVIMLYRCCCCCCPCNYKQCILFLNAYNLCKYKFYCICIKINLQTRLNRHHNGYLQGYSYLATLLDWYCCCCCCYLRHLFSLINLLWIYYLLPLKHVLFLVIF